MYGAGYTAKVCLNALEGADLTVEALIDDYGELVKRCRYRKNVNVILTSIYGKRIFDKLLTISNYNNMGNV